MPNDQDYSTSTLTRSGSQGNSSLWRQDGQSTNGNGNGNGNGGGFIQQPRYQHQQMLEQQRFLQQQQHNAAAQAQEHYNANGNNAQNQIGGPAWGGPFPSLHLWPLNETFVLKMIHLPEGQKIKIGRQTNVKTAPGERNAYFDSKVLSRTHAELWEEGGKIFIKDVKSSNGTFINNDRLSAEGVESEPFELKSEDMVEFGIDIVSEDNRTIVHHKVAARVYCCFNAEDAALSARELANYHQDPRSNARRANGPAGQGMNGTSHPAAPMVMSAGGKADGLSFDHVLHKLQAELQKSRETGQELQGLTSAMTDIQDTLGGGLPPTQNGSAAAFIPPQFRPGGLPQAIDAPAAPVEASTIASLQTQLNETQVSLTRHLEKIRYLEGMLKEHDSIKHDVGVMRGQMEENKREMEILLNSGRRQAHADEDDDDDDARSVMTAVADDEADERQRRRRLAEKEANGLRKGLEREAGRPTTPEPSSGQEEEDIPEKVEVLGNGEPASDESQSSREGEIIAQNALLVARVESLSAEFEQAVQLSRSLQTQHAEATTAVKVLADRVGLLEDGIATKVAEAVGKAEERWDTWRSRFEEGWKKERDSWEAERERLRGVVREWEEASRRAQEEEEERRMNGFLGSDDEGSDDEDEDDMDEQGGSALDDVKDWAKAADSSAGLDEITKHRRPSNSKLHPALRALKAVSGDDRGAATPTQSSPLSKLENDSSTSSTSALPSSSRLRSRPGRKAKGKAKLLSARAAELMETGSTATLKGDEKDASSDSGKDTVVGSDKARASRRTRGISSSAVENPIPVAVSLVMIGVIAWAVVNRAKD